ncbi:MAG: hypothetical protein Q4C68_03220 [Moraxella sp.]|nr:hypothetical protein [Moraxella sp.]
MKLPLLISLFALGAMTGCGYQLRGLDTPSVSAKAPKSLVALNISDDKDSIMLFKRPLTQKLTLLGFEVADHSVGTPNSISITNLHFRDYKLRGVLTETRVVISADVRYQLANGIHTYTLQATRSYQYNEGSVSTGDAQGTQVRHWLYDELATRISEQYYALTTLP